MMAIYKALQATKKNIQVVFLCGNHNKLYKKISRLAAFSRVPYASIAVSRQYVRIDECRRFNGHQSWWLNNF